MPPKTEASLASLRNLSVTYRYFRGAPKLVRFLLDCESPSLSSVSFFFDLLALLLPVAGVGVGCAMDPLSRKEAESGVGACDAGVDAPGVEESWCINQVSVLVSIGYGEGTCRVVGPVGNRGPRKDAVLVQGAGLAPLGSRAACALHVVVKARDDIAGRVAVQIRRLLVGDALFHLRLTRNQLRRQESCAE